MKVYKVGIDLDEVLWRLVDAWLERYNKIANEHVQAEDITEYYLDGFVKSPETLYYILEMSDFWDHVELYEPEATTAALNKLLNDKRFEVYIVSATGTKVATAKFRRVFELLPMLKDENIILTNNKSIVDVDFMIDDYEENLKGMVYAGGIPILINRPHNRAFPAEQYGIIRKDSFAEAAEAVIRYVDLKILV